MARLHLPRFSTSFFLGLLSLQNVCSGQAVSCKCNPHNACWPSSDEWATLNSSVHGRLLAPVPPSSVCYAGPTFDAQACNRAIDAFNTHNESFIVSDPIEVYYQNFAGEPCLPTDDPNAGTCSQGNHPSFVIDAQSVEDIQQGVNFAREKNVRLVIKNTGHSILGTSLGKFGLSIWTHHLDDMEFIDNFHPTGCPSDVTNGTAITFGAGVLGGDAQSFASQHGTVIPTGSVPTVGLVGWLQGGGHGPLSATYGLGADNVLELEVITADGEIRTVNECENTDLFYALRGGGASTFGVVTKATMQVFPKPPIFYTVVSVNQTSASDEKFWKAVTTYFSMYPDANDAGIFGSSSIDMTAPGGLLSLTIQATAFESTDELIQKFMAPLVETLQSEDFAGSVSASMETPFAVDSIEEIYSLTPPSPGLVSATFQSRFFGRPHLTENLDLLVAKLNASLLNGNLVPNGGELATVQSPGPGTRKEPSVRSAVHPAWRETYVHQASIAAGAPSGFTLGDYINLQNAKGGPLIDIAPNTGNYQAESSVVQPDIEDAFWGEDNYALLSDIKNKWDPTRVFYCATCVLASEWLETPEGDLCPVALSRPFNQTWLDLPYAG
ncbi:hypothetical protein F5884DRAFT_801793 [Xylogone sp. PMI_703]|nr:hypothetical protein F5884DRAFT_801793 [Xylogone sp. PMI_703]